MSKTARIGVFVMAMLGLILIAAGAKILAGEDGNIIVTPSAEEIIDNMPIGWGSYAGAGAATVKVTDLEAHTGAHSVMMTVDGLTDTKMVNWAIFTGDSNGYDGTKAYPCEEKTEYHYAFFMKAEDATDWKNSPVLLFWVWRAGGQSGDRIGWPRLPLPPITDEWQKYEGTFTTPEGATTMCMGPGINAEVKIGATLYLDDVYLGLEPAPADWGGELQAVQLQGKLAATWGGIKEF